MAKNCISCGKEIADDAEVCDLCGAAQTEEIAKPDDGSAPEEIPTAKVHIKKDRRFVFEKVIRFGIPAVVILAVLIIAAVSYFSSYKRVVDRYFTSLCKDKVNSYVSSVSDLEYGEPASEYNETGDVIRSYVDSYSEGIKNDIGKVRSVKIEVTDTEKLDDDMLEYLILMSGNTEFDKASVEKGKIIDFSVIITGKDGAKTINCRNYYVLKENGKWKICTSADTAEV